MIFEWTDWVEAFYVSLSMLTCTLLLFLITRITYSPQDSDISVNRLTLVPFKLCIVYLMMSACQCLFAFHIPAPSSWLNLLFRYIQMLGSLSGALVIQVQLLEWWLLRGLVEFQSKIDITQLQIAQSQY
jgi:hypothetical protein